MMIRTCRSHVRLNFGKSGSGMSNSVEFGMTSTISFIIPASGVVRKLCSLQNSKSVKILRSSGVRVMCDFYRKCLLQTAKRTCRQSIKHSRPTTMERWYNQISLRWILNVRLLLLRLAEKLFKTYAPLIISISILIHREAIHSQLIIN